MSKQRDYEPFLAIVISFAISSTGVSKHSKITREEPETHVQRPLHGEREVYYKIIDCYRSDYEAR